MSDGNANTSLTHVLLTGAAGTVGSQVLAQLCERDDCRLTVFERDTKEIRKRLAPYSQQARCEFGDITDADQVAAICGGVDAVIHLAALIPPAADHQPDLANRINVGGTANLVQGLEARSPNAFFLYSSSISVYGDRLTNPDIRVGDPLCPSEGDEYAKTKIAAESVVQGSSLDWSIFRLTAIMGGHQASPLMFDMPLATCIEIATPGDTARAFVKALDHRAELTGRIFNLGGGAACRMTYADFLNRSFEIMGLGKVRFPEGAFATRNFHCGNYADGDELNQILDFRRDNINNHFTAYDHSIPGWRKLAARLFRRPIISHLLRRSAPWQAWRGKGPGFRRFFGSSE